jgi:phosphatidylglycerophosphatase A
MTALALFIASVGYVGFVRVVPGTFGSAAALVLYWAMARAGLLRAETAVIAGLLVAGIWAGTVAERVLARSDPGPVVIDEVVGMLLALAWLPVTLNGAVVGFVLFRVLDVIKPFPAARCERLPGGLGIMADDVVAGLYANLALRAAAWLWPGGGLV